MFDTKKANGRGSVWMIGSSSGRPSRRATPLSTSRTRSATTESRKTERWGLEIQQRLRRQRTLIFSMSKPFRIAMIPASTDGVNYYRMAAWAFEMRKYKNVIVDLLWFKYEIDPSRPHPWQEDLRSMDASDK